MNFLSHLALAERGSESFQFGSMLPDFASMGGGRTKITKDPAVRAVLPSELLELQRGIDFHYFIDSKYDELPEYLALKRRFTRIAEATAGKNRLLGRTLPVLGIDLLLDGLQQQSNPGVLERFPRVISISNKFNLEDLVTSPAGTQRVFDEFCPNLPDYSRIGEVADVVGGILLRRFGKFDPKTRTIEYPYSVEEKGLIFDTLKKFQPWIEVNGPALLDSTEKLADNYFLAD